MKLSEQLKQDHVCGDFGQALEGYSEESEALESRIIDLSAKINQLKQECGKLFHNNVKEFYDNLDKKTEFVNTQEYIDKLLKGD